MKPAHLILLFAGGLLIYAAIATFQTSPGYIDAAYYYATGQRLFQGHGLTETFPWHYLDGVSSLPHPSHSYWAPLPSFISALGMFLMGNGEYGSARLGFLLLSSAIAPLSALLSLSLTSRRDTALWAGCLALFPAFHAVLLPVTDTKAPAMLLGGLFFLALARPAKLTPLWLGLLAGALNLTRTDGLLWALIGTGALLYQPNSGPVRARATRILIFALAYFLVMGPWMIHNLLTWDTFFSPASSYALWLTRYEDTFAYPREQLTLQHWLASGIGAIFSARLDAFRSNLQSVLFVQGSLFLTPLIIWGAFRLRTAWIMRVAAPAWGLFFAILTLVFPFASTHGTFVNAMAPFQPLWWALAACGIDEFASFLRQRRWFTSPLPPLRVGLVALSLAFTIYIVHTQLIVSNWNAESVDYQAISGRLSALGVNPAQDVIMLPNPPAYYLASGGASIPVPSESPQTLLALGRRFNARFLVLQRQYLRSDFASLYNDPLVEPGFELVVEFDETKIYRILP